ncbi:unnamed protein product, partial [Laminaria digitata]
LQDPRNPSNRQKLMRYNSKMEQEHGLQWRKLMEDEDEEEGAAEKEYFPADMVEVQRIITCEVTVTRHEAVLRRERHKLLSGDLDSSSNQDGDANTVGDDLGGEASGGKQPLIPGGEEEDPDDVVLYLVKWRGLPYDQSSWEHFRDIRFASDQILDFWDFCRPRPKEMAEVEAQLAA